jgi:predicted nuclease of predicted toxin-antitoxin system
MKIKLDENLPHQLAVVLKDLSHQVDTVYDEGLIGHADTEIWQRAQAESRFLITQDLDFSNTQLFAPGSHRGILLVRLRSPSRRALIDRVIELFREEDVEDWDGCFVVSTERKVRVLKPIRRPEV